jgi:hypothetical protein
LVAAAGALLRKVERGEAVSVGLMLDLATSVGELALAELAVQVIEAESHQERLSLATRLAEAIWRAFTAGVVAAPFSPHGNAASKAERRLASARWKRARKPRCGP